MKFTKIVLHSRGQLIADFAKARNEILRNAKTDWVLFLDTDEEMSPALLAEIQNLQPKCQGYYLKRDDYFFGKWLKFGETANVRLLRLGRKDAGEWHSKVHEVWKINGKVGDLENHLQHYPHPTIKGFIDKINHYTDIAAKGKKEFSLWQTLVYPPGKFLQNYFLRLGFLDGFPGFVMAFMMSFHSLVVRIKTYDFFRTS